MSITRLPVERMPATTACLTISPEVLGSRPMTIVPGPACVPKACAKRVSSLGVSDWPTTPRTPDMLILRVGIARIFLAADFRGLSLNRTASPVEQLLRRILVIRSHDDLDHCLRVRRAHV